MGAKIAGFIFFCCVITKLQAQEPVKGIVYLGHLQPATGAVIQNSSQKKFTVANELGYFQINAQPGDTLTISHIGYITKKTILRFEPKEVLIFKLDPRVNQLPEAKIIDYTNAKQAAQVLKTDKLLNNFKKYETWPSEATINLSNGISLEGGINKLWMKYSKRGKEITKMKEAQSIQAEKLEAESVWLYLKNKIIVNYPAYDSENVDKCRPARSKLISHNHFDLLNEILQCLKRTK